MNKIFKVIYSKTKHCYVVVSELAKSHCKTAGSHTARNKTALTAAVLLALGAFSFAGMPVAQADADAHNNDFIGANDYYWYWDAKAKKWEQQTYRDALIGHLPRKNLPNNEGAGAKETGSVAAGLYAQAGMQTVTIGNRNAGQSRGSVFIGEHSGYDDKASNVPKGSSNNYVTSVGFQSDATGWGSIAIGSNATAENTKKTDTAVTMTGNTDEDKKNGIYEIEKNPTIDGASVALGYGAHSKDGNIAIGAYSEATTDLSADTSDKAKSYLTGKTATSYVSVGNKEKQLQRRITNVADGAADSDVATIGQLKKMSEKAGVYNEGWGIKIGDYTKKDANGTETTVKNAISVDRNLGTNLDTTGHVHLDVSKTGLVLGTVVDGAPGTDVDLHYGATGDYAVTVGGGANTASGKASVVIGGSGNTASDEAAVSSGGSSNVASGSFASVYGGFDNKASGTYASIFAGAQNKASNMWTTVGGGALNEASGTYASIWGGYGNKATDEFASVYGGVANSAYGTYSAILGGGSNKAGSEAVVSGGLGNEAAGLGSAVVGGEANIVTGANATALGGTKGSVNGVASVGILGGSTGMNAPLTLAAGYQSTVTDTGVTSTPISEEDYNKILEAGGTHPGLLVGSGDPDNPTFKILDHFATAVGYQATADEAQTVAFGHDKGDTYYGTTTYTWKQKATVKDGHYYTEYGEEIDEKSYKSLMNADGTWNDYSQPIATIEKKEYDSAYYNRLVKAADGIEDHDAVVMEQLKNASDVGSKIKVYQTDENGNIKFDKNNNPIEDTSAEAETKKTAAQKASEDAWGSAIGTGKVVDPNAKDKDSNGSGQLVTGGTVYNALQQQKTDLTDALSVNAGWGIDVDKTKNNTISVKHNLSSGDSAYADTDATGLILGGSIKERKADKKYGAATASSVIVGAQNALASNDNSVVVGGLDNVASGANSTVVGGDNNKASGNQSAVFGGRDNTASGITSTASGGIMNVANGQNSTAVGGTFNYALGTGATSVGGYGKDYTTGYNSSVNGSYSVGIAGGSTGDKADYSLAAGRQAVVTTENGTAVGYQATTDESGTISFGHDAGDVSGYTVTWKQRTDGKTNADLTTNDYTQAPEAVTATTYTDSYYNRLVKVAEGQDDHDVVVVKQLKQYAQKDAGNIGSNIKVYTTDKNGNSVEDTDASTAAQKANENLWGTAIGTGKIADSKATNAADNGSQQLVTGGTVYTYNAPVAESGKTLNYVSADKTTGQNLTALDTQVKANADTLNDSTHNIKYYSVNSTNAPTFGLNVYTNEKNDGASGRASLAAGFITHADGLASTVAGSYSGIYNKGTVSGTDFRGAAALSLGTVNINRNMDTTKPYSGVANSLIGQANVTTDSNAAIILGAGNTVKDSYRTISNLNLSGDMTAALKEAVPGSGGQVMVMGGGNSVENAYMTQVTGVGNTVTGSGDAYDADKSSQLNYVEGFYTTLTNGKNDYLIGAHNTVTGDSTDTNKSNIVFGDNHTLTNTKNNIIVGSADNVDTTTVSDVVSIGHNAKVTKEGGVAIGSGSEATTAAGVAGYDPTGATADTTAAWTSKKAAVSVGTADETRQITGVAAGKEETDAVNVAQLKKLNGMKANVNADNIGKNLNHKADGTAVTDEDKTVNENAWGAAIGTGSIAADNGQLVTGKTVYAYNKPVAAEGKTLNYISDTMTTGQNLTALDTQIKTNADNIGTNTTNISNNTENITNLKNLSNITEAGQTVIKNLAKGSIGMEDGSHTSVSHRDVNGVETYKVDVTVDGQVAENNTGIVNGGTVYSALQDVKNQTSADLANKANVDASNIGKNLNHKADGTAVTDEDKTVNENAWGAAIGTGSIAADNGQLVTGKTVYAYNKPVAAEGKTLNYVSDTKTTGQNLGSLDAQVGTNTGDISNLKNLSNISSAGETVIKKLAKGSIGMEDGSHTSVSHRDVNGVDTYKVDVTVDGQVAENNTGIVNGGTVYSALQDVKNQTSADLANKANVDASNLTPDNVTKWQEKLGNGEVVSGNKGLVTGDTVFKAVDTKANRDGSNLTDEEADSFSEKIARGEVKAGENRAVSGDAVSQAISKVTGDMNTQLDGKANTSLDNITKDGQTVIKKLSQDAVQVKAGDDHITIDAKTDETTGNKTYTISAKDGKVASGDTGLISGGTLYNEVHVDKDGSYIRSGNTVGQNLSALDSGLKTTSDLIHTNTKGDTIQIGGNSTATKIDVSGKDKDGNTTGRVITGIVTEGKDLTSAANVGYVNGITSANTQQIYRDMNNAYSRLDTNINRAAAGSNALAALHPLDFDPADKASFAVGYGHYHNANAAAIGAFYQPNANTMVNMGISLGNGDPGFNAGVSFKLGKGSAYNGVSKAEMAQTIHDQAEEISAIKANDAAKDKRIDALEKENQEMKKQIQEILSRLNG
ncbi:ESPR-type extended signal peptide-containing protein [Megasphaera sp. AM44-1BH]|uniref:ESPR-type extended signal peptide-containing protein n=1 Tax=Megasphaera sp. AM44-1BH TaxID=2292358 RepID=UPI0013140D1C|nr:ESPR-type extended signal peptide-containing protein [Megasphaera sp. AM44-1BH]